MPTDRPARIPGATIAVLITGLVTFAATAITGLVLHVEEVMLVAILGAETAFFAAVLAFMRGYGQHAIVVLAILAGSSASACGSSAAGAGAAQSTPNHAQLTIEASGGSTIIMGAGCRPVAQEGGTEPRTLLECDGVGSPVQVWLDNRSGGSDSGISQRGADIKTRLALQGQFAASGSGPASNGDADQTADQAGNDGDEDDESDEP